MLGQCRSVTVDMMKTVKHRDVFLDRRDAGSSESYYLILRQNCPLIFFSDSVQQPTSLNPPQSPFGKDKGGGKEKKVPNK